MRYRFVVGFTDARFDEAMLIVTRFQLRTHLQDGNVDEVFYVASPRFVYDTTTSIRHRSWSAQFQDFIFRPSLIFVRFKYCHIYATISGIYLSIMLAKRSSRDLFLYEQI